MRVVIAAQAAREDVEDDRLADRDGIFWHLAAVGVAGITPNGEDAITHERERSHADEALYVGRSERLDGQRV